MWNRRGQVNLYIVVRLEGVLEQANQRLNKSFVYLSKLFASENNVLFWPDRTIYVEKKEPVICVWGVMFSRLSNTYTFINRHKSEPTGRKPNIKLCFHTQLPDADMTVDLSHVYSTSSDASWANYCQM